MRAREERDREQVDRERAGGEEEEGLSERVKTFEAKSLMRWRCGRGERRGFPVWAHGAGGRERARKRREREEREREERERKTKTKSTKTKKEEEYKEKYIEVQKSPGREGGNRSKTERMGIDNGQESRVCPCNV